MVDIRHAKNSNYNFVSLVRATLLVLTGYSTGPLRLASLVGLIMTLFGLEQYVVSVNHKMIAVLFI